MVARNTTGKYFEIMQAPLDSRYVLTKFIYTGQKSPIKKQGRTPRGYLFIDLIKVTMKTAEISIRPPAAIRPRPIKTMVPGLA